MLLGRNEVQARQKEGEEAHCLSLDGRDWESNGARGRAPRALYPSLARVRPLLFDV